LDKECSLTYKQSSNELPIKNFYRLIQGDCLEILPTLKNKGGGEREMLEISYNSLQAIIALNIVSRNILLAKLAYSQGVIDDKAVEKVKELSVLTMKAILNNTVDENTKQELRKIVKQIKEEIL